MNDWSLKFPKFQKKKIEMNQVMGTFGFLFSFS